MSTKKCVVLFSGNGSNLENLLSKSGAIKDELNYISAFTDNPKAGGTEVCKKLNLDIFHLILNGFPISRGLQPSKVSNVFFHF